MHVRVHDLQFGYSRAADYLFDGFSHDFLPGQVTAIAGASGRGKSTLLYLVACMLTPNGGQVLLDGIDMASVHDSARALTRARHIGFVFQDASLDPTRRIIDSVLEPAMYAGLSRATAAPRAEELLEKFGVAGRARHKPGEISGGQAQRVALCRALVVDPEIVVADEPTGNLDPDNATLVLDTFRESAAAGKTVIVATHDPSVLARADSVVRL